MKSSQNIPSGIILAAVGLLLPYIPNITTDNLQRALENHQQPEHGD